MAGNPWQYGGIPALMTGLAAWGRQPQQEGEWNASYGLRKMLASPWEGQQDVSNAIANDVGTTVKNAFDTPKKARARQEAVKAGAGRPRSLFPEKFDDPAYDAAEANAARITGVPQELIRSIRLNGERSNASQVSTAGAQTPYQVIPNTRQGLIKNYKVDPYKDPTNAALGAAYVLWEQAGRPPAGKWGPEQMQRAAGGYFGGAAGANNPFGNLSDGGTTVGNYTQRVLGPNTGLAAPFVTPNPANMFQGQALGELQTAQNQALQPFQTTIQRPPMPEMPAPTPGVKSDFSSANQWLADMKPVAMTEYDKLKQERRGWFAGLAQGLANSPEGVGVGRLFAMMGGGALAGRMQAQDDIQKLDDRFEQRMALWKQAMFSNEFQQAQIHTAEAQRDVDNMDRYALGKWKNAVDQWRSDNNVTMQGDALVSTTADANGNLTVTRLPVASAVNSAFALRRAELYSGMGNQMFQGQSMVSQANNSLVGSYAGALLSQSLSMGQHDDAAAAVVAAPAMYATQVAQMGKEAEIVGEDGAKSLNERVDQNLQRMGLMPGSKDYTERRERMVAEELVNLSVMDPQYFKKLQTAGRAADLFNASDRYYGRRERRSVDSRGRSSYTVTTDEGD